MAAACGGTPRLTLQGQIRGQPLQPRDAISATATFNGPGGSGSLGAVRIATSAGLCKSAEANQQAKSTRTLDILLADFDSGVGALTAPTAAGTYAVTYGSPRLPPKFALVTVRSTDALCAEVQDLAAVGTTGTVTLTAVVAGSFTGTFDLGLYGRDATGGLVSPLERVTGAFSTTACAALADILAHPGQATCQ